MATTEKSLLHASCIHSFEIYETTTLAYDFWLYYFLEYEDPSNETVCNSSDRDYLLHSLRFLCYRSVKNFCDFYRFAGAQRLRTTDYYTVVSVVSQSSVQPLKETFLIQQTHLISFVFATPKSLRALVTLQKRYRNTTVL